jgi:hypothetical protein
MHIEQVSQHFFKLNNVLPETLLNTLQGQFKDRQSWAQLNDAGFNVREELSISIRDPLARLIHKELAPVAEFAETQCKKQLYPNAPQLWYDAPGYISNLHKDHSPNLTVNVQVYLTNSQDDRIGTHCFDNEWYSVPYVCNCGYLLIGPTDILHGMKEPVIDQRLSLYQSYRSTVDPVNIW